MKSLTKVLKYKKDGFMDLFEDWNKVRSVYCSSCHCTAITTDMESYIEVEALTEDCLNKLCSDFVAIGFEEINYEECKRDRPRRKDQATREQR